MVIHLLNHDLISPFNLLYHTAYEKVREKLWQANVKLWQNCGNLGLLNQK